MCRAWWSHKRLAPRALLSSDDFGSSVERTATLHPLCASAVVRLDQGVVSRPRALYSRGVALVWAGGRVANDDFLVHAPRPLVKALIRTAGRLAPSRGLCRGVGGAA
jgi:hypothetical protein